MIVVGIDPGTNRIGYALIAGDRRAFRLVRGETITIPPTSNPAERLFLLESALVERLTRDCPDALAVEKIFFTKNAKTAIGVAEARGIILLTARRHVRSIWEYAPLEVKMALTGYGRADKNQVRRMVKVCLPGATLPKGDDAVDAVAIALTALFLGEKR